ETLSRFSCAASLAIFSAPLWIEKAFRSTEVTAVLVLGAVTRAVDRVAVMEEEPSCVDRLALNIGALLLSLSALMASLSPVFNNVYDVTEAGRQIHQLQSQGHSVSYVGKYHNTFGFAGKLEKPLKFNSVTSQPERNAFLTTWPGYTIWVQRKKTQPLETNAIYMTPYRGRWLFIVDNQVLANLLAPSGNSEAAEK
ncbi:glycosyl transferase, partial [Vibrio sp. M60_M31a]